MPVDEIVSSGQDRIIVYEGAEEKLKQLNSGFLEKLGVGNSGWEDSERERYRVNLVPVENQLTSGESANGDQRLLEQSQEIFEEEEMEYVELQDSEEQQYKKELRYLDEPNQSSIYSENDEDEVNYSESTFKNRSDNFQSEMSSRNTQDKSKISREEEPIDVEPLEKLSTNNSQNMISNDKEIIDIEDPW